MPILTPNTWSKYLAQFFKNLDCVSPYNSAQSGLLVTGSAPATRVQHPGLTESEAAVSEGTERKWKPVHGINACPRIHDKYHLTYYCLFQPLPW